jgi:uncharacterized membrane protein YhaH (DUF805 family)
MYEGAQPSNEGVYVPPKAPVYRPPSAEPVHQEKVRGVGFLAYFFSMRGRMSRGQHFLAWLFLMLLGFALSRFVGLGSSEAEAASRASQKARGIIGAALILPIFYSLLCVHAKRWHDRGMSAFMVLITVIPVFGPIWVFFQVWILPGNGMNAYGPEVDDLPLWPTFGGGDGTEEESERPNRLLRNPIR